MKKKGRHSVVTTAIIVIIAVSLVAGWSLHSIPGYRVEPGNHVAEKAFYDQQSDLMVEVSGEIVRVLGKEGEFLTKFAHGLPAREVAQRLRDYLRN